MNDDTTLLRRYAETGDQDAFAELVRRHVDLVYAAAYRRTDGASGLAADVAQEVFTSLARHAGALARHPVLSAWLHTATRNAALNLMISEQRRRQRERAAIELTYAGDSAPAWEQLRPVLDAAIDELSENDRAAVVLRFLEKRPFPEIGAVLRVSEDAARMRTERALEKLRAALARRGITSTAAALAAIVGASPTIATPAGLAATLATTATVAASASAGLLGGVGGILFMNTKLITVGALCAILAFTGGMQLGTRHALAAAPALPDPSADAIRTLASLQGSHRQLQAEIARLQDDVSRLGVAQAQLLATPVPPPRTDTPTRAEQQQRAMLNNLRQIAAARDQFILEHNRQPVLADLVGPENYIKALISVDGESYDAISLSGQTMTVTSPNGVTASYEATPIAMPGTQYVGRRGGGRGGNSRPPTVLPSPALREAQARIRPAVMRAIETYIAANPGQTPPTPEALAPYFSNPQEAAEFLRTQETARAEGVQK